MPGMSLATTQALSKDSATDVDTNTSSYAQRFADESKSVFSVAGLTLPNEKKMTVSHETGKSGEQRHLVRLDRTEVDAFGVPATVSVYLVIVRPPNTALTNAIILEEVNKLVDFLVEGGVNANVVAVLNGEV
jgi:hypothetical protein